MREPAHPSFILPHYDVSILLQVHLIIGDTICFVQTFLFALASTGAVRVGKMGKLDKLDDSNSDAVAEATGFDGFGGFGGFRGFHQFNGFVSNAFGDLEGQFDTSGFNKDFSASQNRKFDAGLLFIFYDKKIHAT
jgi:hypothetical protein